MRCWMIWIQQVGTHYPPNKMKTVLGHTTCFRTELLVVSKLFEHFPGSCMKVDTRQQALIVHLRGRNSSDGPKNINNRKSPDVRPASNSLTYSFNFVLNSTHSLLITTQSQHEAVYADCCFCCNGHCNKSCL